MTVLDVSLGKPAEGVHVNLQVFRDSGDLGMFDPVSQQFSPFYFSRSVVDHPALQCHRRRRSLHGAPSPTRFRGGKTSTSLPDLRWHIQDRFQATRVF